MSSLVLSHPSALRPSDNQHLCNNQNNEHWHRLIMVDKWLFTACWIFLNCLGEFGQTWCQLNLEGAGSMMDVFTGIPRNTTSSRCFPDTFNNVVIFHESQIKNSIMAWESFGAWHSSTRFQNFWQISDLLPEGDLWPAAVFSFSAEATCLVLMDIWTTVLRVVLSSITSVVLCYLCYLRLLYSVFMDIWTC